MKILKFGGSSLGSVERIRNVADIVLRSTEQHLPLAVVVSAVQGMTDQLIEMGLLAGRQDQRWLDLCRDAREKHIGFARTLLSGANRESAVASVETMFGELDVTLREVSGSSEPSPAQADYIVSFGERLSASILADTLKEQGVPAEYLDARDVVKTDEGFGRARVYLEESYQSIRARFATFRPEVLPVITGFIGATARGQTTTLGRGGSDYTAAIFGAALDAAEIEIWTDVDGVMTADPKKVERAVPVRTMTYEEAMELAHFGAKVIYPPTIRPALHKRIPIRIKNSLNPTFEGTVIRGDLPGKDGFLVTGISSSEQIALLRVQGCGMIGVAGIAERLFGALARKGISVILITQASSEHSICLAIDSKFAAAAKSAIGEEFRGELAWGEIDEVVAEEDVAIVAVVGEHMRKTPGVAGKVFETLGKRGVNVVAIAQGSSELNISIVVSREDEKLALNTIHDAFFPQPEPGSQSR